MRNEKNLRRVISLVLILVLAVLFTATTDSFFGSYNLTLLLRDAAYTGLIALGVGCVMVSGGVDLSAGGIVCLVGIVTARASFIPGIPGFAVMLVAVAAGLACGLLNGFIVNRLHLSEFVTTLASGSVFTGLSLLITFRENGRAVPMGLTNRGFLAFGKDIGGIYFIAIAWIILAIVMQIVFTKTPLGTHISAMGSNGKAAEMSGISVKRIKYITFGLCGAFAGLASGFVVAYQTGTTQALGSGMEFQAIAACVVGGVVLGGGKGDALSAVLGAAFMTIITNGLYKWGLSTGGLYLLQGIIIVAITNFDTLLAVVSEKRLTAAAHTQGGDGQ